jgi:hypothetical protein
VDAFHARLIVTAVRGRYSCDDHWGPFGAHYGTCDIYARFQVSGGGVGGGVGYQETSAPETSNPTWNYAYPAVCASGTATVTFSIGDDDGGTFLNGDDTVLSTRTFTIPAYTPGGGTSFTRTTFSTTFSWTWHPCGGSSYTSGCSGSSGASLPCTACTSHPLYTGCAAIGQDRIGSCGYGTSSYACRSRAPTRQPTRSPTRSPTRVPTRTPTTRQPTRSPTARPTLSPTHHPCRTGQHACVLPTSYCTVDLTTGAPILGTGASQYACLCNLNQGYVTRQSSVACDTVAPTAQPTNAPTAPTASPTAAPTATPTAAPTATPTATPTGDPTAQPSASPTAPTASPSAAPTATAAASTSSESIASGSWLPIIIAVAAVVGVLFVVGVIWWRRKGETESGLKRETAHVNPMYGASPWGGPDGQAIDDSGLHANTTYKVSQEGAPSAGDYSELAPPIDNLTNHKYSTLSATSRAASVHAVAVKQGGDRPDSVYHVPFADDDDGQYHAVAVDQGRGRAASIYHVPFARDDDDSEAGYHTVAVSQGPSQAAVMYQIPFDDDANAAYNTPDSIGAGGPEAVYSVSNAHNTDIEA